MIVPKTKNLHLLRGVLALGVVILAFFCQFWCLQQFQFDDYTTDTVGNAPNYTTTTTTTKGEIDNDDAATVVDSGTMNYWIPKPWEPVTHRLWCKSPAVNQSESLMYTKVPKTSSSTLVGINIRIAHHVGSQVLRDRRPCSHTQEHGRDFIDSRQSPLLLWTMLRDPAARALSAYYHFGVSRENRSAEDAFVLHYLKHDRNYSFNYIRVQESEVNWTKASNQFPDSIPDWYLVQRTVLEPYNFIGLVERRDESLAVMKLLWNMSTSNFVAISAKLNGGYDDGRYEDKCVRIQKVPQPLPANWLSYLSNGFRENNIDYVLYSMVNRTLDKTIERLGIENVKKEVEKLRWLQGVVNRECVNRTILPCSPNGTRQHEAAASNCYYFDSGCGYPCVDEVVRRLGYFE